MTVSPRALCVLLCLAASGCFGGPTSDWPPRASGDGTKDGNPHETPPENPGSADAGVLQPRIDAGAPGSWEGRPWEGRPCMDLAADGGGRDAGVGVAAYPIDADAGAPVGFDGGCR